MKDAVIILRGNLKATLVVKTSDLKNNTFTVYYMLSRGKLPLKDSETNVGSRSIDVKKDDIICIWSNHATGYEELCGWFNDSGDISRKGDFAHKTPNQLRSIIRDRLADIKNNKS